MSDNEVNKIIAEYMGLDFHVNDIDGKGYINNGVGYELYTSSLDALVPVWEKLGSNASLIELVPTVRVSICNGSILCKTVKHKHDKTIQQASAHATAKAILKLKEQENDTIK